MKRKPYKNQLDYLYQSDDNRVQQIAKKVTLLQKLDIALQQAIHPPFNAHAKVGNYRDGLLVIMVSADTWATPLRFQLPDILQKLRQDPAFAGISQIDIKVMPPETITETEYSHKLSKLSANTARYFEQLAEQCEDDQLAQILQRLATHQKE